MSSCYKRPYHFGLVVSSGTDADALEVGPGLVWVSTVTAVTAAGAAAQEVLGGQLAVPGAAGRNAESVSECSGSGHSLGGKLYKIVKMQYGPNFKMPRCSFRHVVISLINENSVPYNFLNICDVGQRKTL